MSKEKKTKAARKAEKPAKQSTTPPPALPAQEFIDTVEAHNAATAGKTPQRAREALLAGPREIGEGLTIHPANLCTQIILEDIAHPIMKVIAASSPEEALKVELTGRDVLNLIFIFAQPEEAWRALSMSKDNFYSSARQLGMKISPQIVPVALETIRDMLIASARSVPGNTTGSEANDPLAPSPSPTRG